MVMEAQIDKVDEEASDFGKKKRRNKDYLD
jgi:hypothetical protein